MPDGSATRRFETLEEAEDFIAKLTLLDPEGVSHGEYYLDVLEEFGLK
jgi:hypothetical protein